MTLDVGENTYAYGDGLAEVNGFLEGDVRGWAKALFKQLRAQQTQFSG